MAKKKRPALIFKMRECDPSAHRFIEYEKGGDLVCEDCWLRVKKIARLNYEGLEITYRDISKGLTKIRPGKN